MKSSAWIFVVAAASMTACLGMEETSAGDGEQETIVEQADQALRIDPCALVRCRAGTQCEVQQGRPLCVPVPVKLECTSDKECRLFSNYCEGCECLALSASEPNPICKGHPGRLLGRPMSRRTGALSARPVRDGRTCGELLTRRASASSRRLTQVREPTGTARPYLSCAA